MSTEFLSAIQTRRTHYGLSKVSTISDEKLKSIVETAVKHIPSPFNVQSARAVLLLGEESDKLWRIVLDGSLKVIGDDEATINLYKGKISGYSQGYGTVLFFEDSAPLDKLAAGMPAMAQHFPVWSKNSTGMLQFVIWTALATEGLGASLQHHGAYSTFTHENVLKEWNLPSTWKSTAMMPFGVPTGAPGNPQRPKTFLPIEDRVRVFA